MAACLGVDFFDSYVCSDHSLGTNQESYLDRNIPALTLEGAYDLNVWLYANLNNCTQGFIDLSLT